MGTVHKQLMDKWLEPIEACIKSIEWDPKRVVDPFEGLSYKLKDTQGLLFALNQGGVLVFNEDGLAKERGARGPMLQMWPAGGAVPAKEPKAFAEGLLRENHIIVLEVETVEPIKVNRLPGFEVTARSLKGGEEAVAHLVVLFDKDLHWITLAEAGNEHRESALPKLKAMARSFERDKPKTSK